MFDFLRNHQVDLMLGLSSICGIIALFTFISKAMPRRRKYALLQMEIGSAIWLWADRVAYLYHGIPGTYGYWMVRISNFLVFVLINVVLLSVSLYIEDVLLNEGEIEKPPIILNITKLLSVIAICLVVISQFTGIYYTFDENNIYTRSPYYFISYVFPYFVLIIQLATLVRYRKRLRGKIALSVFLFDVVSLTASMIQLFAYGVSLVDMAAVVMVIGLYIFALLDMNERVERANQIEINQLKVEQQNLKHLFEQTVTALATAIDAKDNFTRGHSLRVAEYAREIARLSGMDEKKCDEVYFAALVHDVGKIGIKDDIIQKDSNLSDEEYEIKKKHTEIGGEILSSISEFPFLSIGAKYHHERFDGKGYPSGLSGTDIPDIARIVAVADSYDDLTSGRSYRDPLPQSTVREEIVKGQGTLFDPEYARIMVNMIDKDTEYMMREKEENINSTDHTDLSKVTEMRFEEYKNSVSDGLQITDHKTKISFKINSDLGYESRFAMPSIILFDSFDGCVHNDDRNIRVLNYIEYGEIWLDGNTICTAARDIKSTISESGSFSPKCEIEAVRIKDHVRIKIRNQNKRIDVIVALLDAVRFAYIGITGEHCKIQNITVEQDKEAVLEDYIPRIAQEVNYINNLQGDIPNVQINGYRSDITKPLPVRDGMRISFFTKSLPSANLIWHCAYVLLFSADDEKQDGTNYREFACIRIDGEDATKVKTASNELVVRKDAEFESWDVWKERNKKGFPCEITFKRRKNKITMVTSNAGISIKNTTIIPDNEKNILVALTGDQCTLTNIIVL
ncbi:HD domain-containing phosphohydrolase [Butyrivibrio sp. WCE2006]|uniref:HD domain-containing phosphohydrolase n=1 Tax=Butyrivibrio sp. WCE2006 TaxID=1410611 RepID=UPI0005D1430B|nr:HD domain-containing phosphohydrolase [Butyrivibrio sp. WCE2006]